MTPTLLIFRSKIVSTSFLRKLAPRPTYAPGRLSGLALTIAAAMSIAAARAEGTAIEGAFPKSPTN